MPTSPKGIPYPATLDIPDVPADMQRMAEDLDFSKIPVLSAAQIPGMATLFSAYPLGLSLLYLSPAEAASGGWPVPASASCHILTIKTNATRAAQYLFRVGATPVTALYRQLIPDPGPHSPWVGGNGHYAEYIGVMNNFNTATNPTAALPINWPAGRFTQPPRVLVSSSSNIWYPATITSVTTTGTSVVCRNLLGSTGGVSPIITVYAVQHSSSNADTD